MIQVCQIFPGGKQFTLKNNGEATCAVSYQGGFVMIGGYPGHNNVDRWEKNKKFLFPIFLSDTTLKANTLTLYPIFLKQDGITPAPRSNFQTEKRFDQKICLFTFLQGLLVAGGYNGGSLSSTELYLPSTNRWTRGGVLPRYFLKITLSIIIVSMMIISSSSFRSC